MRRVNQTVSAHFDASLLGATIEIKGSSLKTMDFIIKKLHYSSTFFSSKKTTPISIYHHCPILVEDLLGNFLVQYRVGYSDHSVLDGLDSGIVSATIHCEEIFLRIMAKLRQWEKIDSI